MNRYEEIMAGRYGQRYLDYREAYQSEAADSVERFPLEIDLDLTDACNLKCPTCHSIGRPISHKSMDKETVRRIVEECGRYDMPAVNIGGCGEPLIHMDLVDFALSALKNTSVMDIFFHTNGVLLSEDYSRRLIDGGVTYLCVSIDALSQDVYQKMRGSDIGAVIENVERFLSIRQGKLPALRVSFLAASTNVHEKDGFIEFWKDKADIVEIQNYVKSYEIQPDAGLAEKTNDRQPVAYRKKKRMAIVAPDILCESCGGLDVENAIEQGNTLAKYRTIKNYWDHYVLKG